LQKPKPSIAYSAALRGVGLHFFSLPVGVYHLRVQTTDGKLSGVGMVKE